MRSEVRSIEVNVVRVEEMERRGDKIVEWSSRCVNMKRALKGSLIEVF